MQFAIMETMKMKTLSFFAVSATFQYIKSATALTKYQILIGFATTAPASP